jgi:hypothetical protein
VSQHRVRRAWWLLGVWRCSCGRRPGHQLLVPQVPGARIPDGDLVLLSGYRRAADALAGPGDWRWWS